MINIDSIRSQQSHYRLSNKSRKLDILRAGVYGPFISRQQATAKGIKDYFTGIPCKNGHVCPHRISGSCWTCCNRFEHKAMESVCKTCGVSFRAKRCALYCSKRCTKKNWERANIAHIKQYNDRQKEAIDWAARWKKTKSRMQSDPKYRQKKQAQKDAWAIKNPAKVAECRRRVESRLYGTNIQYKLKKLLRTRIASALRAQLAGKITASSSHLLGCQAGHLKAHLESKFKPGMSWDNWSRHGWHIDHIKPCASFDLSDPNQQRLCFHYTNLQPLWARDSLSKSSLVI